MATGMMNYVGSISILDRGDAPAQAVLDRNARSLAQRAAEETKDELSKVMNRVEHIYGNFELSNAMFETRKPSVALQSGMEYVNDMHELEELIQDQVKKKKYQQQITIFVVGFQDISHQKLRLLQQVNEFFMENTKKADEEVEVEEKSEEVDLDGVQDTIEETLKTTEDLTLRLGQLHQEVVDYMYNYAQARITNKSKKKLEKALTQAKDDINHLNEKLLNVQQEIEEKDEKIQQLFKQSEIKTMEIHRYRTAAEVAKKSTDDIDHLFNEIKRRDEKIRQLQKYIGQLEIDVGSVEHSNQQTKATLAGATQSNMMKVEQLQQALEEKTIEVEEAKRPCSSSSDSGSFTPVDITSPIVGEYDLLYDDPSEEIEIPMPGGTSRSPDDSYRMETIPEEFVKEDILNYGIAPETTDENEGDGLQRVHEGQIDDIKKIHREEIEELRQQHGEEMKKLLEHVELIQAKIRESQTKAAQDAETAARIKKALEAAHEQAKSFAALAEIERDSISKQAAEAAKHALELQRVIVRVSESHKASKSESQGEESLQASQKYIEEERKKEKKAKKPVKGKEAAPPKKADVKAAASGKKPDPKRNLIKPTKRLSQKELKEAAVQDEDGNPQRAQVEHRESWRRENSQLPPVNENLIMDFDDEFLIDDEDSWSNVLPEELLGRFAQFRKMARENIADLESKMEDTVRRTTRKINTIKAQFQEHKARWEEERKSLLRQVEQAQLLQQDAEEEANAAMAQLEDFISQEEMLNKVEEEKAKAVKEAGEEKQEDVGAPGLVETAAATSDNSEDADETTENAQTSDAADALADAETDDVMQQKLLEMTDDAKVLSRQRTLIDSDAASTSGSASAPELREMGTSPFPVKNRSDMSSRKSRKNTVVENWLDTEQSMILSSLKQMLGSESHFTDAQHRALKIVRASLMSDNQSHSKSKQRMIEEDSRSILVYCLACHLTHESVMMGIDPTSLMKSLAYFTALSLTDDKMTFVLPDTPSFTLDRLLKMKSSSSAFLETSLTDSIKGKTMEDVLESSAKSRANLLNHHRNSLAARRASLSDRKSRPFGSARSQRSGRSEGSRRSSLSAAELDENGDMPFPPDNGDTAFYQKQMQDMGTSPMTPVLGVQHDLEGSQVEEELSIPVLRKGLAIPDILCEHADLEAESWTGLPMAEHPIVEEYLKTYDGILSFRDSLSQVFMDKDMTSASQVLAELDMFEFNREEKVQPQLEKMTLAICKVLEEAVNQVNAHLFGNRDYPVSAMNASQEPTVMETSPEATPMPEVPDPELARRDSLERQLHTQIQQLSQQNSVLEKQIDIDTKKFEEQLQHNTVLMMEMQDTISNLKRQMSLLQQPVSSESISQEDPAGSPVMFTRLDSDRNAKILKRAVDEQRITTEQFQEAVKTMDEYVSLPAKRLGHLVRKYVHHVQMRKVEAKLQRSRHLENPSVIMTLNKMEALQSARADKWADEMDSMASARLQLAGSLMDTLGYIEQESGIFLIKPYYSYRAHFDKSQVYQGKLSRRPWVKREPSMHQDIPASHVRVVQQLQQTRSNSQPQPEHHQHRDGVLGTASQPDRDHAVWMPGTSQSYDSKLAFSNNTPRLLELDVNRMLIGQNQVSMKVLPSRLTDDRLTNVANASVRSYITVNRPTNLQQQQQHHLDYNKPSSGVKDSKVQSSRREPTVSRPKSASTGGDILYSLPSTPPLPPIAPSSATTSSHKDEPPVPPHSPPGSSLRQTPYHDEPETRPATRD